MRGRGGVGLVFGLLVVAAPVSADQFLTCGKKGFVFSVDTVSGAVVQAGKLVKPGTTTAIGTASCDRDPATGRLYFFEGPKNKRIFGYWTAGPGANGTTVIVKTFSSAQQYMKRMACPVGESFCYLMNDGGSSHNHRLYTIAKSNGLLATVGTVSGVQLPQYPTILGTGDMVALPDGTIYLTNLQSLFRLDLATMTAVLLYDDMLLPEPYVFTGVASCGGTLYVSLGDEEGVFSHLRTIDPITGVVTPWLSNVSATINDLGSCAAQ